ncbi:MULTISPECIES: hypothetical protein [Acetobacter]|uniref:hypothetical protein n=1 Tax=Acetobacter TaxID=434 RepID=UPI00376FEBDB
MRRVVEYQNLTFESSNDGILQIWFEAQCDEEFLLARIYGQDRETAFERITPQVLTGWALYRSSKPKGLVSGIYASLRPRGSVGDCLAMVEQHLRQARESERRMFVENAVVEAVAGMTGMSWPLRPEDILKHMNGGGNAE